MRKPAALLLLLLLLGVMFIRLSSQVTNNYFINTSTGSDSNDGLAATVGGGHGPWLTVAHAISASTLAANGATVTVAGTLSSAVTLNKAGAASGKLFILQGAAGAKITNNLTISANYNVVKGFEFTCPSCTFAINVSAGTVGWQVLNNNIHDYSTTGCTSNGVINDTNGGTSLGVVDGNRLHHAGATTCGNLFHGMYLRTGGIVVTNNIVSGVSGGWGIKINPAVCTPGVVVSNNTVFNNAGGIDLDETGNGCVLDFGTYDNNIIVNNGVVGTGANQHFGFNWFHVTGTHNVSSNNMIYGNLPHDQAHHDVKCGTDASGTTPVSGTAINGLDTNGSAGGCPETNPKTDSSGVTATFVNFVLDTNSSPSSPDNPTNYKLKSPSNAVQAGTTTCAASPGQTPCVPALDYAGTTRTNPPSIGAFDFSGGGTKIVQVTPNPNAFPDTTVGNTSTQVFTVKSIGTANLTITGAFAISPTTDFHTGGAGGTCFNGQVLAPNATCTASGTFQPSSTGAKSASYNFFTDATAGTYTVPLSGNGLPAPAPDVALIPLKVSSLDENPLDQGLTPCPETGTPTCSFGTKCWKWTHDSGTPGTSCGNSAIVGSPTAPSVDGFSREFDISWTGSGGERYSILTNPGASNLDSASTAFVYDATVYVNSLTGINQLEFDYNQVLANGDTMIFGTQCNFPSGVVDYTRNNSGAQWVHSTIPCTRAQWNLAPASNHLIVTYHRDASGNITYDSWSLNGTTTLFTNAIVASEFSLGWTPLGAQVLNFQMNGSSTAGSTSAFLDQLSIYASAATLTFPNTPTNTASSPLQVVILNSGTAALSITNLSTTGPFQLQSDNCPRSPSTLAVQASCRANVTYNPVVVGADTGTLVATSNASSGSTKTANLKGTSVQSNGHVTGPASLSFPDTFVGSISPSQDTVVTNTGTANEIVTIAASGDFTQTSTCVNGFTDTFSTGTLDPNTWTIDTGSAPGNIGGVNSGTFSAGNVDLSQGMLGLKVTQTGAAPVTSVGAEVRSIQPYWYGTYTWNMREASTSTTPNGAGGVDSGQISSVFDFINNSQTELDIVELEGQSPDFAEFTTWNTTLAKQSSTASIANLSTGFHQYKVTWAPGSATYFVDGVQKAQHTANVPTTPAYAMTNVWGTNSSSFGGLATTGVDRWMYVSSFSFVPSTPVILPGGTCRITVKFAPTQAGTRNGSLTVTPSDGGPVTTINLGGLGINPTNGARITGGVQFSGGVKVLN